MKITFLFFYLFSWLLNIHHDFDHGYHLNTYLDTHKHTAFYFGHHRCNDLDKETDHHENAFHECALHQLSTQPKIIESENQFLVHKDWNLLILKFYYSTISLPSQNDGELIPRAPPFFV